MKILTFSESECQEILKLLAAILHLGNICFQGECMHFRFHTVLFPPLPVCLYTVFCQILLVLLLLHLISCSHQQTRKITWKPVTSASQNTSASQRQYWRWALSSLRSYLLSDWKRDSVCFSQCVLRIGDWVNMNRSSCAINGSSFFSIKWWRSYLFFSGPQVFPGNEFDPSFLHDQQREGDQTPQRRSGLWLQRRLCQGNEAGGSKSECCITSLLDPDPWP